MSERTWQYGAAVAVPLLIGAISSIAYALSLTSDHSAASAIVEQRLLVVERAVVQQSRSAKAIEDTVTQMRIDQASFVSGVTTRIDNLESGHGP